MEQSITVQWCQSRHSDAFPRSFLPVHFVDLFTHWNGRVNYTGIHLQVQWNMLSAVELITIVLQAYYNTGSTDFMPNKGVWTRNHIDAKFVSISNCFVTASEKWTTISKLVCTSLVAASDPLLWCYINLYIYISIYFFNLVDDLVIELYLISAYSDIDFS